jgi:hypothetical protein
VTPEYRVDKNPNPNNSDSINQFQQDPNDNLRLILGNSSQGIRCAEVGFNKSHPTDQAANHGCQEEDSGPDCDLSDFLLKIIVYCVHDSILIVESYSSA